MSAPKPTTRSTGLRALAAGLACLGAAFALHLMGWLSPVLVLFGVLGTVGGATLAIWGDGFRKLDGQQKLLAAAIAVMVMLLLGAVVVRALGG